MSFSKFMIIPIFVAAQATSMMMLAPHIPGTASVLGGVLLAWVAFQAWATYFMAGCTPKMGVKVVVGYLGGILASVGIFELAALFSGLSTESTPWGLYLAVFLVVIPVIAMERAKGLDFVPAYFVGAGAFFALMTHVPKPEAIGKIAWYVDLGTPIMIACVMGVIYGWITVAFRGFYEKKAAA